MLVPGDDPAATRRLSHAGYVGCVLQESESSSDSSSKSSWLHALEGWQAPFLESCPVKGRCTALHRFVQGTEMAREAPEPGEPGTAGLLLLPGLAPGLVLAPGAPGDALLPGEPGLEELLGGLGLVLPPGTVPGEGRMHEVMA